MLVDRPFWINRLQTSLGRSRVVALLGPRQCGKTTLARTLMGMAAGTSAHYFDLEEPATLAWTSR